VGKHSTGRSYPAGPLVPAKGAPSKAPAKGVPRQGLLPPPPVGTYDPSIDYNAGASQRGYDQTFNDAQTAFEQGQQDYQRALANLGLQTSRENENYGTATSDLVHQFGILGHQQADHAAQQGILSQGLLQRSADVRGANEAHDQSAIDVGHNRTLADIADAQKTLDVNNARQFGGFNGAQIIDPLTGQPEVGSLVTQLTRSGGENNAFQSASAQQRAYAAAQGGYVPANPQGDPAVFAKKLAAQRQSALLAPRGGSSHFGSPRFAFGGFGGYH
jgi:hypothetical protein